jgi:hypothetical protein
MASSCRYSDRSRRQIWKSVLRLTILIGSLPYLNLVLAEGRPEDANAIGWSVVLVTHCVMFVAWSLATAFAFYALFSNMSYENRECTIFAGVGSGLLFQRIELCNVREIELALTKSDHLPVLCLTLLDGRRKYIRELEGFDIFIRSVEQCVSCSTNLSTRELSLWTSLQKVALSSWLVLNLWLLLEQLGWGFVF